MKMKTRWLILSRIVLVLIVTPHTCGRCRFPDFVTRRSMWIATYDNEASMKSKITNDTIESSYCTNNGLVCAEFVRKCNETRDHDKFIVEHTEKTQRLAETEYLCIQFIRRSDDVIQFKTSTKMAVKSPAMCDNLNLDHWPLTSPSFQTAPPIRCPFTGGYNMVIRKNGKELCANKFPIARMESECGAGTGIVFDFKNEDCIHDNLKMNMIQHVECMAQWTTGNQTFVILRPDSDDFQPYCLRITSHTSFSMVAYLFMDFVCDPGNSHGIPSKTGNYLSITFKKYIIDSLCEDEYQECKERKFCHTDMEEHCKKSCNHCRPEINICPIPEYLRGYWGVVDTNITSFINVSSYEFHHFGFGKMQCLKSNHTEKNQITFVQMFSDGCYPKFTCLEVHQVSPSIRHFRFGNRITWPVFPVGNVGKLACTGKQFTTAAVIGNTKQTIEMPNTTMIDPKFIQAVDCGLANEFGNDKISLYFQEGNKCDGCISFEPYLNKTYFTISTIDCSTAEKELHYHCLASFKYSSNTTAVITKQNSNVVVEFLCWVFTGSGANRKLIVLKVSECNELSISLAIEGTLKPKASFDIKEDTPKECPNRQRVRIYSRANEHLHNTAGKGSYRSKSDSGSFNPNPNNAAYRIHNFILNNISFFIMLICVTYVV